MFNENKEPKLNDSERISHERKILLERAIESIKQELGIEELEQINAILLYGSSTIGEATETSDVDLFISPDNAHPLDKNTFSKIKSIFKKEVPDIKISFNFGSLSTKTRSTRISVRSTKNPDQIAKWEFLYAKDDETRDRLNANLEESQKFWESIGWNKTLRKPRE